MREGCEGGGKGPLIQEDKSATLATGNNQILITPTAEPIPILEAGARTGNSTTDLRAGIGIGIGEPGDPMFTLQAGKQHAVVYENHAQDSRVKECSVSPQINAKAGTGGGNLPLALSFTHEVTPKFGVEVTGCLDSQNQRRMSVASASAVRRLTPRECERLQGFPDDYTLIPWKNGTAPDGPRYKALGNSMAVPVMRWIGERIAAVESILKESR